MSTTIDSLKAWSHVLFWCSVLFPLVGVIAGVARFYVDRKEKSLSSVAARVALEESRRELQSLKSQTAPRRLSEEQKAAILKVLSEGPSGPITFVSRLMDGEGAEFAKDIGGVFSAAKWTVAYNRSSLVDFQDVGLALIALDAVPPEGEIAVKSLNAAGIKVAKQEIKQEQVSGVMQSGIAFFIGRR